MLAMRARQTGAYNIFDIMWWCRDVALSMHTMHRNTPVDAKGNTEQRTNDAGEKRREAFPLIDSA